MKVDLVKKSDACGIRGCGGKVEQKKQLELSVAGLEIRAIAIIWKTLYSWALIAIDKYKYTYFV